MSIQGSQTNANMQFALSYLLEESTILDLYEKTSYEEILIPISFLFNTNSRHLRFIANELYELINGEVNTLDNLMAARERTNDELLLYQEFSQTATDEGFDNVASLFNGIANILRSHLFSYEDVIGNIVSGTLYCKPTESLWICLGCGNIISGLCAPESCPVCGVDGGFYAQLSSY